MPNSQMQISCLSLDTRVSNHLAVYQKTDKHKKIQMGKAITGSLTPKQHQRAIMGGAQKKYLEGGHKEELSQNALTPNDNVMQCNALVPFEPKFNDDIPDFYLLSTICDFEKTEHEASKTIETKTTTTSNVVNQIPKSFFANCQIGTINLNFVNK